MKVSGSFSGLSSNECQAIHDAVLYILGEIGVKVENQQILKRLSDIGARVDYQTEIAFFPKGLIELTISKLKKFHNQNNETEIFFNAGGNSIRWLDPLNGSITYHTLRSNADYTRLADALENISSMNCMGFPSDVPPQTQPFYIKLHSWKYTRKPYCAGSDLISTPEELDFFEEMSQIYCEKSGKSVAREASVLIHKSYPLVLDRGKATLYLKAWEKGLEAAVAGGIPTVTGSAPCTLAGALSLSIADKLMSAIINLAYYEDRPILGYLGIEAKRFPLYYDMSVLDMRTCLACMSRPEACLLILALGDMCRFYGVGYGHGGYGKTQAKKIESVQSGVERVSELIVGLMAGAKYFGSLGIISEPEGITSPVQLVIDNEIASMLKRMARGFEVDSERLAVEIIKEAGPNGVFLGNPHTAENMRQELWFPQIFQGGMGYEQWLKNDVKTEVERAKERVAQILAEHHPSYLDEDLEMKLIAVIKKAEKVLAK